MVKTRAERIEPCIPSVFTKQENEVDPAKETKKELPATVEENQEAVALDIKRRDTSMKRRVSNHVKHC